MPTTGVASDTFLQLLQRSRPRRASKQCATNLLGGERTRLAHDHILAVLNPFEYRTPPDAELSPHLRGNGGPALGRDGRACVGHIGITNVTRREPRASSLRRSR